MPRYQPKNLTPPPRALPDFPASFARIREAYEGFTPRYEYNRGSFGKWLAPALATNPPAPPPAVEAALMVPATTPGRPIPALLQRHFYWSATCFVRAYYLLLAYLTLDRRAIGSWARVTGYYSRFYTAKAISNLCLASWVQVERPTGTSVKRDPYLLYTGSNGVRLLPAKETGTLKSGGSHEQWWNLFRQLRYTPDLPSTVSLGLIFDEYDFTAEERNAINYSDKWMEGFPELEWFDTTLEQMQAHFAIHTRREDDDFTDIDRFFRGMNPEYVEASDFYGDPVQWLWHPLLAYLDLMEALPVRQTLVTYDKLMALTTRILGDDFPNIVDGIRTTFEARAGAGTAADASLSGRSETGASS